MSVDKMGVYKMSVDNMSSVKMSVDKLDVNKNVNKMSVDTPSVDNIISVPLSTSFAVSNSNLAKLTVRRKLANLQVQELIYFPVEIYYLTSKRHNTIFMLYYLFFTSDH